MSLSALCRDATRLDEFALFLSRIGSNLALALTTTSLEVQRDLCFALLSIERLLCSAEKFAAVVAFHAKVTRSLAITDLKFRVILTITLL